MRKPPRLHYQYNFISKIADILPFSPFGSKVWGRGQKLTCPRLAIVEPMPPQSFETRLCPPRKTKSQDPPEGGKGNSDFNHSQNIVFVNGLQV